MKKLILPFFLLFFMTACSSNSPEQTAEKFLNHLANGEIDAAKEYGTSSTRSLLDLMNTFGGESAMREAIQKKKADGETVPKIDVYDCVIEGDKATCQTKDEEGGGNTPIMLKKIEGEWKVDISKESMDKESMEALEGINDLVK